MTQTRTRRPILTTLALTIGLPLALAACGSGDDAASSAKSAEPMATVAAPAGQTWMDTAATTPEGGVVVGNPQAPIKLIEYASHTCGHCATFSQESSGKIDGYVNSGRVSYELRNQIHDPLDLAISMLARCGEPAAFQPLAHEAWADLNGIIERVQANPQAMQGAGNDRFVRIADAAGLIDFFAARGISREKAVQCLSDTANAEALVKRSTEQSETLGVTGTPTFFINGQKLDGTNWQIVETALQDAGAR